ncbi:hypothetical protein HDU96_003631 [Phlyctochytrium bullatum]|nr:hypothetical protein HDU96_003631 [Phlyctochytrium bullatum]
MADPEDVAGICQHTSLVTFLRHDAFDGLIAGESQALVARSVEGTRFLTTADQLQDHWYRLASVSFDDADGNAGVVDWIGWTGRSHNGCFLLFTIPRGLQASTLKRRKRQGALWRTETKEEIIHAAFSAFCVAAAELSGGIRPGQEFRRLKHSILKPL